MKRVIKLTESDLKNIIKESVQQCLSENDFSDDNWIDYDDDSYEERELRKAVQKSNGTYKASTSDGTYRTGDKVIVSTKKGEVEGVVTDVDINFMTFEEELEVDYVGENGKKWTMICVPTHKVRKVE